MQFFRVFSPPGSTFLYRFLTGSVQKVLLVVMLNLLSVMLPAQTTFPVNGINDPKEGCYAFTNATIVKDAQTTIQKATLLIRSGKIIAVGDKVTLPPDAQVIDCSGKYIYPSFIDIHSSYGMPATKRSGFNFGGEPQPNSNTKGAYGWNEAIKAGVNASGIFVADDARAKAMREAGIGAVLTHQADGIARGTGVLVSTATDKENKLVIRDKVSAHYSFDKGSSTQDYPGSLMGSIALLRQTFLDARWYKTQPVTEGVNLSLQAWNEEQLLPQIFEANDKWNALRADKIGDEFGVQYIIKAGGNEYQRINEMAATGAAFILPLNFPAAIDVEDPVDARFVALSDLKHWEMAPAQPAAFEKATIPFCFTASDLKDTKQLLSNIRKAMEYGLSEAGALNALTKTPASLLKIYDKTGSLEAGKIASFLICSGPVFGEKTILFQNWVQGAKYSIKEEGWTDIRGVYNLTISSATAKTNYTLDITGTAAAPAAKVMNKDTISAKLSVEGRMVKLSFPPAKDGKQSLRMSGVINGQQWTGTGEDINGNSFNWWADFTSAAVPKTDSVKKKDKPVAGDVYYPFNGYGWGEMPKAGTILIRNATVWTSEKEGKLSNTDVLVTAGKITAIGKNLSANGAVVIDGTGKHLTAGIIDEHSHIAISRGVNEGTQTVTSEVRIGDVLNPDDVNIYRQLSGGVTSSHLLHGSANTIGGQTQLIKLRWGAGAEQLKFANWDPFIKFALGENVKQSNWGERQTVRFPQTRMGVEQVLADAFTRARDYEKNTSPDKRRNLQLDALVEILNKKRFITCHSYVQSEITMLLRVAERFGFRVNTFTHILEGYKVADKMKAHNAGASTFADWWTYKMEVLDAIPYNATIMQRVGLTVAINSDDAEMARRLNQEAAKSVKYGSMEEQDALRMVTINPAKLLHIDDRTGSIKTGKDADLVLWNTHPLSIYAMAEKTIVDGIVFFDREKDKELRKRIATERNRLIQKMISDKKGGASTQPAFVTREELHDCGDVESGHAKRIIEDVEN
jgi:imidazolonepropionase-like amidohydrolase